MTAKTYIPSDDDANTLLDAVETETDPGKKARIVELLGRYRDAKQAAGLEPFQPDQVAAREQKDKVAALYAGLDKVATSLPPDAAKSLGEAFAGQSDTEEITARSVNQAWLMANRPDLAPQIDADWPTMRREVARSLLGKDADMTDRELYAGIAGHITAKKAREEKANEVLGRVQMAAFAGQGDWLTAYRAASSALEDAEGITPQERDHYRTQAQRVFEHAAAKAKELRPLADMVGSLLANETNAARGQGPTLAWSMGAKSSSDLIPTIAELPQVDRMLLYRMIAGRHEQQSAGEEKGTLQKVAEKFGRQIRDLALGQIASLDQSNLAGVVGFAERLKAGEPGMIDPNTGAVVPSGQLGAKDYMAKGGFREATAEETAAFIKDAERRQTEYQVALELKDIAENVVDPAKFDSRIADALANAPGQLGYTVQALIPFVGIPLLINSTKEMRTRELMQRGVPLTEATDIATASAVVEAPVEWIQSKMLFGRIPGMGDALSKPLTEQTLAALGKRAANVFAAEFLLQNVQEAAQDATPLLLQEITAQWDPAVPKTTRENWLEFADSRIDTAFTLLPITLIGTGVASFQDGSFGRDYLTNATLLKAAGFTDAAIEQIMAEPTLAGMQGKVQALWPDADARTVGTAEQTEAAAQIDAQHQSNIEGMPLGSVERNADGTFTVRDSDGIAVDSAATPEAAQALVEQQNALNAPETLAAPFVAGFEASNDVEGSPLGLRMPNAANVSFTPSTENRTSAPAVIDSFAKVMESIGEPGVALNRVGRMGRKGRKALGWYQVRELITRIKTANDVSTAAHEMAHALEDALFGKGNVWQHNAAVSATGRGELLQLGKDLYGATNPAGGYHSEGFAEFTRLFLTDPAKAKTKAPQFFAFWEGELAKRPTLAKAMTQAQQLGQTWFQQGAKARAESGIVQQPSRVEQAKELAATTAGGFNRNFIEQAAAIESFVKEASAKLGREVPADLNPMFTLTARRLTADAVVEYMANKAMLDWAGNVTGKPLVEAFKLVGDKSSDFLLYLWARRAIALWTDPNGPRNPGLDRADAEYLVDLLKSPQFERAAAIVYDWNNGVLDYAAQASPDFAQTVAKIRAADPGFYIPLFREFEAFDNRMKGAGGVKGKVLVAKLKGSGRRIKDPVESMLTHAKAIVLKAQQKAVLDQILTLAETVPGLGHYIVEVPAEQVPAASVSLSRVLTDANKKLTAMGAAVAVTGGNNLAAQAIDLNSEVLTFFAPAYQPKQNENPVLPVYRNGKVRWYEMDGDLYAALSGMDIYRLPKALDMLLGIPARTMRLGTTGLNAAFSLVTNPIRDFRTLHLNSQASANTAKLFFDWLGMLKDTALEAITNGKAGGQWADLAERLGVVMAQPLGQDSKPLQRAARRLKRGGEWKWYDPRDQYDFVVGLLQFTETASRLTEIKNIAEDMGWDPSQPLTPEIAAKLATAGKQVTTDFTQAGQMARAINQAVPFFNAAIQGPVAHLRAIKADPSKFAIRGLMMTALALANWWRNRDEEWWKEMPLKERYGYTYVPVGDELLRIPRAFEADGLFMAGAEALADAWYQKEPEQAAEWFGRWLGGFTQFSMVEGVPVPPLPVLASMAAEQLANRDFFSGASIVPQSQQDIAPKEQFGPYTARASIKIGEVFGVSPRRVDHAINSIFGGVGSDLVGLLGRGNKDLIEREREGSDLPVIGVLFQRGGPKARSPESIEKFYDLYGERVQQQRSRFKQETVEQSQQRLMLADAAKAVAILEDVKLVTKEKAARSELESEQIAVARDVVKAIKEGRVDRGIALRAKADANTRQFMKVTELEITNRKKSTRPLREFAFSKNE